MESFAYLLFDPGARAGPVLRERLLGSLVPALAREGAQQLNVAVCDEDVAEGAALRIGRSEPPLAALIRFGLEEPAGESGCQALLSEAAARCVGYGVEESVPKAEAPPAQPDGRTPGFSLVTCIRRKAGLSQERFLELWLVEHRAVALQLQSTYSYVRDRVQRPLTPDAPDWDGIVEEGFPIEALTDPMVWYAAEGSPETLRKRQALMLESCRAFLDFGALESTPMSQYRIGA